MERKKDISPSTVARNVDSEDLVVGEGGGMEDVGGCLECVSGVLDVGETVMVFFGERWMIC